MCGLMLCCSMLHLNCVLIGRFYHKINDEPEIHENRFQFYTLYVGCL